MNYFEWNRSYNSGIEIIDAQHKRLIQLINLLYTAMQEGNGNNVINFMIDDLLEYTYYHFETEERIMIEQDFEEFEIHRGEHDIFAKKMLMLKDSFDEKKVAITLDLANFLKEWWQRHILESDMKFINYNKRKMVLQSESKS